MSSRRLSHAVAAILARSVSQNSPHVVEVQGLMVFCYPKEESMLSEMDTALEHSTKAGQHHTSYAGLQCSLPMETALLK